MFFALIKIVIGWLLLVLTVISSQTIVTTPVNTAAKVDSQAIFNCTADTGDDYVTWDYESVESNIPVRIYTAKDGEVRQDQQDKFGIERDDANGVHNLVIKNVQIDLGVRYFCGFALEGVKTDAELVAVSMLCNSTVSFRRGPGGSLAR